MTAITFNAAPRMATVASKPRSFFEVILEALDAFATYRMQRAIPEAELRRVRREINWYRRLMQSADDLGGKTRR